MELDPVQDPTRLLRRERLVEARPVVRIQIVLDQQDPLGPRVVHFHEVPDAAGVVPPGATFGHLDVTPAPQRLAHHQLVADAFPLILVVHMSRSARAAPPGLSYLTEELLARLVEADDRAPRVVGPQVGLDHVLHPPDVIGVGPRRDAPGLDDPWLDVVFLRAWRTVSVLIESASPSTTSSSASSCRVQRQRPRGGSLQASWISRCSMSPLILILLALHYSIPQAVIVGGSIMLVWMGLYFRFHHQAARFAIRKSSKEECADFEDREWEAHLSGSLEDANHGLNAEVAFVGLIVFSVFETLSGLGQVKAAGLDLAPDLILRYGPVAYVSLMLVTSLMGLVSYLRIRVAIGKFSLMIDPTDRPFRTLKLTDSLLGYLVIAFLFTVSLHLLLSLLFPVLESDDGLLLMIDAMAFLTLAACEQMTLVLAARSFRDLERPIA